VVCKSCLISCGDGGLFSPLQDGPGMSLVLGREDGIEVSLPLKGRQPLRFTRAFFLFWAELEEGFFLFFVRRRANEYCHPFCAIDCRIVFSIFSPFVETAPSPPLDGEVCVLFSFFPFSAMFCSSRYAITFLLSERPRRQSALFGQPFVAHEDIFFPFVLHLGHLYISSSSLFSLLLPAEGTNDTPPFPPSILRRPFSFFPGKNVSYGRLLIHPFSGRVAPPDFFFPC